VKRRVVLLAAGILALGSIAAVAVARGDGEAAAQTPSDTKKNDSTSAMRVPRRRPRDQADLVERVTQGGTLGYGDTTPLRTTASGSLTTTSEVGRSFQRGDLVFSVDGRGVQLFYGNHPFWRDLAA